MILEAQSWENNSDLIQAVFDMHVWPKRWAQGPDGPDIMDVTYGKGVWWQWVPGRAHTFTSHDIKRAFVRFEDV